MASSTKGVDISNPGSFAATFVSRSKSVCSLACMLLGGSDAIAI